MPDPEGIYSLGVDVAAGGGAVDHDDRDRSAICVVDCRNHQQCAEFVTQLLEPTDLAVPVHLLATFYASGGRESMKAIEANNHGNSTIRELITTCQSTNFYSTRRGGLKVTGEKWMNALGYVANENARIRLIDEARRVFRYVHSKEYLELVPPEVYGPAIKSRELLSEIQTFQFDERGKPCAPRTKCDDRVIAWGLAVYIRDAAMRGSPKKIAPAAPPTYEQGVRKQRDAYVSGLMRRRRVPVQALRNFYDLWQAEVDDHKMQA